MHTVLAIDIGGTKIAGGLVTEDGDIIRMEKVATRVTAGGSAILRQVSDLLQTLRAEDTGTAPAAIGIATGGQIDDAGQIVGGTDMIPGWIGLPLRETISTRFQLPTVVLNDGHAAAIAESHWGAGQGFPSMLCLVIGTGLGGGLVIDGRLHPGTHGLGGSVGQLKVRYGDSYTPLESLVSGPGLVHLYQAQSGTDTTVTAVQVAERARQGDESARQAIAELGAWFGLGISHALHVVDAACVVVGGSVAQIGGPFLKPCRQSLKLHGHSSVADTPVLPARFGSSAGVIGAAIYAFRQNRAA